MPSLNEYPYRQAFGNMNEALGRRDNHFTTKKPQQYLRLILLSIVFYIKMDK